MVATSAMSGTVVLIGDVHGHAGKLRSLWVELEAQLGSERFKSARVILLGDLCDRGPETKGVLDFLACEVPELYPAMEVRILAGNHDLGWATFLHLLPVQGGDAPDGYDARRPEPPLWEEDEAWVGMHLQGRRWGAGPISSSTSHGVKINNAFESEATFQSYGVQPGDRAGLLAAMPEAHKRLLASLDFVVEMEGVADDFHPEVTRLVAVHAGLESTRPVQEQMASLRAKTVNKQWLEALQGRANVVGLPCAETSGLPEDVLVASGHHGHLKLDGRRLIVDSCGGHAERPLTAVVLPERLLVKSAC